VSSTKAAAQRTGALYLLFSLIAIVGEFLFPTFTVPGDAAATARNITGAEFSYRLSVFIGLITLVIFVFLVVRLYSLLKDVDKGQAMLMVLFVAIGVAVAFANQTHKLAPLVLLNNADPASAFSKPQLEALALDSLGMHRNGSTLVTAFWGLWLFPFGTLVIKSRFLPRVLGILLLIAGFAYVTTSATAIVLPAYRHVVSNVMTPLYFGEVPIVFWLLLKGVKVPQPGTQG
jgi:predicted transporter